MKSQQEYMKNVSTIYLFSQFLLNFPSMPFSSDLRMLISQQSSTTPVRPAESINTKTEVFFMRELRNTKIIAVDHGYGNMKTANTVTPTGIKAYETEPIFTGNILEYNGGQVACRKLCLFFKRTDRFFSMENPIGGYSAFSLSTFNPFKFIPACSSTSLRKKADMLFMPDTLNLVVRMYCSSSLR